MRWIVGIDAPRSRGALQFARWLTDAGAGREAPSLLAVRVLDSEHLRFALLRRHLDEVLAAERAALERQVRDAVGDAGAAFEVVPARTVAEGLEEACARHRAAGIVVARAAPRRGHRIVRLGDVARGLLTDLACPVLVVPPDLTPAAVGDGPVVAASSLDAASAEACRLARSIADATRRDLALLHAAGAGEEALARWSERHRVWPDVAVAVDGDLEAGAVAFAAARRAPLVAVGGRPSPGVAGAIEPRPWRWLAAHASEPVLVAPEPEAAVRAGRGRPREGAAPAGLGGGP